MLHRSHLRTHLRAPLYVLLSLPLSLAGLPLVAAGLLVGTVLSVTALGPWVVALTLRGAKGLGNAHRVLARSLLGYAVEAPEPPARAGSGLFARRRALLGDRAARRAAGWALLAPLTVLVPLLALLVGYVYGVLLTLHPLLRHWNYTTVHEPDGSVRHVSLKVAGMEFDTWPRLLVPVAVGLLLLLFARRLLDGALAPHRALLRSLLGPSAADRRIAVLEETRAQAVEDAAATLRRIERDLHDGTQARLVGLGMHLTMIRELVTAGAGPEQLLAVVDTAQGNAKQAIADLRALVRGIHPPVLNEGIGPALDTLAADSALPVTVTVDVPRRPSPALESIAYFCAAELLANAVKHSGASAVAIAVTADDTALRLRVEDDGRGGARVGAGSGLTGLLARVRTVDGTLSCTSPEGGPTVVTVVLPYS
ncbi:sensor histidine kinase [Streptomyces mashuensis]|nr:sensor histidine kinase [Streptomyces mashuensis]